MRSLLTNERQADAYQLKQVNEKLLKERLLVSLKKLTQLLTPTCGPTILCHNNW